MEFKSCSKCNIKKPWTEDNFYKSGKSSGVLRSECKDCTYREKKEDRKKDFLTYDRSLSGHLRKLYRKMKYRVNNQKGYLDRKLTISRDEFFERFIQDSKYLKLHKKWKNNNYKRDLTPSVDRVDNSKGYTYDNIQIITFKENRLKGTK